MQRIRLSLYVMVCFVLIAMVPLTANAGHAWGNYHWERSANPVSLVVGDNVSDIWKPHLALAVADWNMSTVGDPVLDLAIVSGTAKGKCRPTAGMIEACNDFYGNNGWLGLAQIWVSGDHIEQGVTKVNDTYFSAEPYNTPKWRQFVMCQEIGHDFGLGHQDEDFGNANLGSCMDYTSDPGLDDELGNWHPNSHDYDELAGIYTHTDGGSGGGGDNGDGGCNPRAPWCNNGNNGVAARDLHSQAEWGQLVRTEGRTATYERDFGGGSRVVTFVIWAN